MNTSEKLKEYLEGDENRLLIETNSQLLTIKDMVEELYCAAKTVTKEQFRKLFADQLEKNKQYLKDRELKVVEELKNKELQQKEY
ncbi:MAG: hypothetical protein NVSMB67_02310 [Flavisolibacter sp.]